MNDSIINTHAMPGNLRVLLASASPSEDEQLLAEVCFDTSRHNQQNPRHWPIGLSCLNADELVERWFVNDPVEDRVQGDFAISDSQDWAWLGAEFPVEAQSDMVGLTERLFLQLHQISTQLDKQHVARLWIIIPDIHSGAGDQERYKLFCTGRHLAYEQLGICAPHFPAATVIGSHSGPLRVHALLSSEAGQAIENPLQTAAYHYPRSYGPNSPSFSRALRLKNQFLISGTAAIRGSDSLHPDDVVAQLQDIDRNLEALCAEQKTQTNWHDEACYGRIYLRDKALIESLQNHSSKLWPVAAAWPVLHGSICREELLCEVETSL